MPEPSTSSPFPVQNLPILAALAPNLDLQGSASYLVSYPVFVDYFQSIEKITPNELIIGVHFVYGWMPTILTLGSTDLQGACTMLNRVKAGERLQLGELVQLQHLVNNSVVGLSKLLHFIRPDLYPIWDSNVAGFVAKGPYPSYKIRKVQNYLHFIHLCDEVIANQDFEPIHQLLVDKLGGHSMSRFRTLDLIMFTEGSKLLNQLKEKF